VRRTRLPWIYTGIWCFVAISLLAFDWQFWHGRLRRDEIIKLNDEPDTRLRDLVSLVNRTKGAVVIRKHKSRGRQGGVRDFPRGSRLSSELFCGRLHGRPIRQDNGDHRDEELPRGVHSSVSSTSKHYRRKASTSPTRRTSARPS